MDNTTHVADPTRDNDSDDEVDERFRPLEERLRRMNWPQPPPGLLERSLEEVQRKIAEAEAAAEAEERRKRAS